MFFFFFLSDSVLLRLEAMAEKIVALKMWEKTLVKARILLTKWKNGGYWFTWSNV